MCNQEGRTLVKQEQQSRRLKQAEYLQSALARHKLTAREVARQIAVISQELRSPRLAAGHQSVSAWVNGTRKPTSAHRKLLASVLQEPLADLNRACEADTDELEVPALFQQVTAVVHGEFQNYRYRLPLKKEIDITKVAVYEDWTSMFGSRPAHLMRHLRRVKAELFGWIPDHSVRPLVEHSCCLVPLQPVPKRVTLRVLDDSESSQRRVWFAYLPDGNLHAGIGYRDRRLFWFAKSTNGKVITTSYPLSRVELVGFFFGSVLFHFDSAEYGKPYLESQAEQLSGGAA